MAEERHFTDPHEFLDALRPSKPHWLNAVQRCTWVFRGQSRAEWALLAKAFREKELPHVMAIAQEHEALLALALAGRRTSNEVERRERLRRVGTIYLAIVKAVRYFESLADELGFRLPDVLGMEADGVIGLLRYHSDTGFRWEFHGQSVALAQHHDIPTHMLDFTREPRVAAFFAAVAGLKDQSGNLAVWGVNIAGLPPITSNTYGDGWSRVRTYNCPRHDMAFLHAQHGLFLIDIEAPNVYVSSGVWQGMETILPDTAVRKYTFPRERAAELLHLLRTERISRAHLMPTMDNVASTLLSEWYGEEHSR